MADIEKLRTELLDRCSGIVSPYALQKMLDLPDDLKLVSKAVVYMRKSL